MIVSIPFDVTSYVTYLLCLTKSLDLTYYWCLGIDPYPEDDAVVETPVAGDYRWGLADQVVELEDGVPAQRV